jgi:hypothetical protein
MCAMTGYVEVASSVDVASLERWDADVEVVQFQQPLREADYRSLAAWLSRHPSVALRVYGFDRELTTLGFLRWFPHVRRLSVDELYYLTDLTPLQHLDRCVEWLDIGQTLKPLDLRPLAGLQHVRQLRVVGHRRGLGELIEANAGLQGLALWRLPVDRILPGLMLPDLQSLAVTRGSLTDSGWLGQFRTLRYLALRAVRTLVDLQPVAGMVGLRWLWLDGLAMDRLPDFGSSTELIRVDCTNMRHLRHPTALNGLAAAPRLEQLLVTESQLPIEAFIPFADHPRLEHAGFGLGTDRRNRAAKRLLGLTPPPSPNRFAAEHGLAYMQ